jgi:outer membrane protein assembly complex protein YaeT
LPAASLDLDIAARASYSRHSHVLARPQFTVTPVRDDAEGFPMTGTDARTRSMTATPGRAALIALVLLAAFATQFAFGQAAGRDTVAQVVVVGNRNVTTERVMTEIRTRPGVEYTVQRVQEDINRLAATHLFKHLAVRTQTTNDGRLVVIFEVQEHPRLVREVVFKHAKHLNEEELQGLTRIRKGMPLDKTLNQLAVFEIQDALKKKGRYWANVTLEEGFDESHDRVVFNITEGPIVRVRQTSFTGNEFATSAQLRTHIETSRAIFFKSFGGVFVPQMVDEDVHKLEEYFRQNGFLNVHVTRESTFSDDLQYVDIVFHIQEGSRFRVKNTFVEGTKNLPADEVKKVVLLKEGEWYNEKVVEKDKQNLADYWGWRGYPVNVQPHVTLVANEKDVVRVQYQVEEKAPLTVGRIIIVGNKVTRDEVIRRALGIYSGQVLRLPELRIAEQKLARLGIFEMDPEKGARPSVQAIETDDPTVKDILVTVQETHTGTFQIGAGFNTDNGLVGTAVLNERNFDITRIPTSWEDFLEGKAFRGANQEFRVEAMPGINFQRYSVTWRDPMIFSLPYSLTVSGYYRDYQYNEYLERRLGGRFVVGKQLTSSWSVNAGLRIEDIEVANVPLGAPPAYTSVEGHNFLIAPSIGTTWDTRDSFLHPTTGGILDARFEEALGEFTFPIVNVAGSRYFTVSERKDGTGRQVVALRSQVGFEGANAPVYERFFVGGMQSIRGFQFRGVGPNENGFMLGGTFMWINSIEYQLPILASDNLHFVVFADSGTAESSVGIKDYRVSAGFGFRIQIPALGPVPIALDFGFPINRLSSDNTQIFNIWFGMSR